MFEFQIAWLFIYDRLQVKHFVLREFSTSLCLKPKTLISNSIIGEKRVLPFWSSCLDLNIKPQLPVY